jgi:hypothetical protein
MTIKDQRRPTRTPPAREEYDAGTLSSLTRLLVGGALVGIDLLTQQLEKWEREADSPDSVSEQRPAGATKIFEQPKAQPEPADALSDQTRYAALGLLFYSQKYAKSASQKMARAERAAWTLLTPLHKPLRNWRVFGPARRRYAEMVTRGEAEIDRWVTLGRDEAQRSRRLAEEAIDSSIDESIDFVATSPQVRSALQETSTGLANEVAGGMRSRSVSYDTLLENLARRLIRRPPRQVPAEPPFTAEMLEQDLTPTDQIRVD